jgi:RNA polymerase sigma-70 factor (ECF subfamily)
VRQPVLSIQQCEAAPVEDEAFGEARLTAMFHDHFDFIWRLLRRSGLPENDADDAAQQVFIVATQKLDRIEVGSERTYLYGKALSTAQNYRRTARRRPELEPLGDSEPSWGQRPDQRAELAEAWSLLDELLEQMPPELSRVLALSEIEELQLKEIAELERIPRGTAASRLRRARERFGELLTELGPDHPFGEAHEH